MTEQEVVRLARMEEKLDMIINTIAEMKASSKEANGEIDDRLKPLEVKTQKHETYFRVMWVCVGGAWAVLLLFLSAWFGKMIR